MRFIGPTAESPYARSEIRQIDFDNTLRNFGQWSFELKPKVL
jgi:hypothetical protein